MKLFFDQKNDAGCGYAVENWSVRNKNGKIIVTEM